jgi:hypothetical protein
VDETVADTATGKPTDAQPPTTADTKLAAQADILAAHDDSIDALRGDVREIHARISDVATEIASNVESALQDIAARMQALGSTPGETEGESVEESPHPLTVTQRLAKIEERLFGAFVA